MKNKELIEELKKFNPDGECTVEIWKQKGWIWKQKGWDGFSELKTVGVEDNGCAMINSIIIAKQ